MRSQTICKDLSSEMEPKRNKQQRYPAGRAIPLEQRAPSSSIPLPLEMVKWSMIAKEQTVNRFANKGGIRTVTPTHGVTHGM